MKRRANGEGSVFKLKDGSWRAACPGGRPSFRGPTRAEAIRRREAHLTKHRLVLTLSRHARDSFAALLSGWLDSCRASLRPRTVESYHDTVTRYVIPSIGNVTAGRLAPDDIERAMREAKSARTQNYIRSVCHVALEWAIDRDLILKNPARKVARVASPRTEREMPVPEQWTALLTAIDKEATGTRALLFVLAFCGLREGEACGLKWSDYDGVHLRIVRAADRDGNLVPVKTAAGRRSVPVSERAVTALAAWREKQDKLRAKWSHHWAKAANPDLVFTTRYGTGWNVRNVLRAVHRVTKAAGMGQRSAHYLRHLAISHLVAEGVDIKTVQTIAGHSSIRVTLDTYGHLIPGQLEKAAAAMNRRG